MNIIEILLNGETFTIDAAETAHETGKTIAMRKDQIKAAKHDGEVTVMVNGEEKKIDAFMTDVRAVSKHMKTAWIENKIMGDIYA